MLAVLVGAASFAFGATAAPRPGLLPRAIADYRQGQSRKALNEFLLVIAEEPGGKGTEEALRYVWEIAHDIKKTEASLVLDPGKWRWTVEKARGIIESRRREASRLLGEMDKLATELPTSAAPLDSLRKGGLFMNNLAPFQADDLSRLKAERDLAAIRQALKTLANKPAPREADVHEIKGYLWLYQGDLELAVQEWQAAWDLGARQDAELAERLAQVRQRWELQKKGEEAEHELQLGISDFKAGNYQRAYERMQKAASIDPSNETAQKYLESSKAALTAAAREGNIQALLVQGRRHYEDGRIFEAVQDWVGVLILDAKNEEARRQLERTRTRLIVNQPGAGLVAAGQPPAGASAQNAAAPMRPPTAEEKALAARQAQEAYALGLIYYNDGDLPKAKGAFSNALRAQPDYAKAKKALEQVEAELKNK